MGAREATGKKVLGKLLGKEFANGLETGVNSGGFGSEAGRLALGTFEELKNHLRAGMNNGLSAQDLEATLTQLIPYVGFPTIGLRAAGEVLQERAVGK